MDKIQSTFPYRDFTKQQLDIWKSAAANYNALNSVEMQQFKLGNASLHVQFNVERYRSTTANINAKQIKARPCFLCSSNRPKEQITYKLINNYELLVNPFPIFSFHYTIPHLSHRPQKIVDTFIDFLVLSQQLSPLVLFYNGAFCGASAPDHLHFQAFEANEYIEKFNDNEAEIEHILKLENLKVYTLRKTIAPAIIIKSNNINTLQSQFDKLVLHLQTPDAHLEPMINVLCSYSNGYWFVKIIPRKKHRPNIYAAKEDSRIRISPACIDLSGLLIIPFEDEFRRITAPIIAQAFDEVCLNKTDFELLCNKMAGSVI